MPEMPQLNDDALKELLSKPLVAKLATTSQAGAIRITPIWFGAENGTILMSTWEDTAAVKNLKRDPKCSLLIDTTDFPYTGVHYWGSATVEGPENDVDGMAKLFASYRGGQEAATEYAKQLIGWGKRVYIRFTPERNTGWDFRQ
jgi:PPOX class probable F420-dependent enzyme